MNIYNKISHRIEDLILAVVALGILVVSIEYVQYYLDHRTTISYTEFSQRIALFITVVIFTSYYFIAYTAYFNTKSIEGEFLPLSSVRTVVLYLNDLAQVTIASWLYAALLIGNLTSAPNNSNVKSLAITIDLMQVVFFVMLLWHLVVVLWYFLSKANFRNIKIHSIYSLIYAALCAALQYINFDLSVEHLYVWILIAIYFFNVISLYYFKGIYDIDAAVRSHEACLK
jgi:hypothetical protein